MNAHLAELQNINLLSRRWLKHILMPYLHFVKIKKRLKTLIWFKRNEMLIYTSMKQLVHSHREKWAKVKPTVLGRVKMQLRDALSLCAFTFDHQSKMLAKQKIINLLQRT